MFQCDDNFIVDIEDLIFDFLNYRRNKKCKSIRIRSSFQPLSLIEDVDFEMPTQTQFDKSVPNSNIEDYQEIIGCRLNELSQQLDLIIDEILNEYEYDGSPIFNKSIDRETLAQIVQKVLSLAAIRIDELKNILNDAPVNAKNFAVNNYSLLKSLIEALIINNIFLKRLPLHRQFNNFLPY